VQPDLVVHLPEAKSIVLDSKVSLSAWVRYQSANSDEMRDAALKEHVQSIRQHIKNLGEKRYSELPGLDALDFVLMFVPVEAALIAALQADPELTMFALNHRIALISPTNFLATMRTVASVWAVHRQNRNAHEIARRAGMLYDKFCGFVENLQKLGDRLRQAQESYDDAYGQLSTGAGNLVRQTEMLRELGARNTKQLEAGLVEQSESHTLDEGRSGLLAPESE
jgi:DNA recombination protein RmuC